MTLTAIIAFERGGFAERQLALDPPLTAAQASSRFVGCRIHDPDRGWFTVISVRESPLVDEPIPAGEASDSDWGEFEEAQHAE